MIDAAGGLWSPMSPPDKAFHDDHNSLKDAVKKRSITCG